MSQIDELSNDQLEFLAPYLSSKEHLPRATSAKRPWVTVTYATSLDGMISISPGVRTTLSGAMTKSMTHYLRLKHDAILIGVGTMAVDDASLTCRYPRATLSDQPWPVVLDPRARWSPKGSAVVRLFQEGKGRKPYVLHRAGAPRTSIEPDEACTIDVDGDPEAPLDWSAILARLKENNIDSIMIEGGATVLNSLLAQPELVDAVIVTVAPTWLGQGGVHVSPPAQHRNGQRVNVATLSDNSWMQFGQDVVLCGRLKDAKQA